jgi:hypothetical protein
MERWMDIKGYEGTYQVSDQGQIRIIEHTKVNKNGVVSLHKTHIMKQKRYKQKGLKIRLYKNTTYKDYAVSRLVAYTFYNQNINDGLTVNHIDGNNTNNHLDNLEIITLQDNIKHAFENGLMKQCIPCTLVKGDQAIKFRSYAEASRHLNMHNNYIAKLLKKGIMEIKGHQIQRG